MDSHDIGMACLVFGAAQGLEMADFVLGSAKCLAALKSVKLLHRDARQCREGIWVGEDVVNRGPGPSMRHGIVVNCGVGGIERRRSCIRVSLQNRGLAFACMTGHETISAGK